MNPRDVILGVMNRYYAADEILAAMAEHDLVVVHCPPGGRVVVDRTEKPCETCGGTGRQSRRERYSEALVVWPCGPCGGSGVVEATTTYGLDDDCFLNADAGEVPGLFDHKGERLADGGLWVAVALPEETPHA